MLYLVPLAGPRREMTDGNWDLQFIGQVLNLGFPQTQPGPIAAPGIGRNEKSLRLGIVLLPHPSPPTTNGLYRKFRRVMIEACRSFMAGGSPIGLMEPHIPQAKLRSAQGVVAKNVSWRTLGASVEEASYLDGIEQDEIELEMSRAAG